MFEHRVHLDIKNYYCLCDYNSLVSTNFAACCRKKHDKREMSQTERTTSRSTACTAGPVARQRLSLCTATVHPRPSPCSHSEPICNFMDSTTTKIQVPERAMDSGPITQTHRHRHLEPVASMHFDPFRAWLWLSVTVPDEF
jgi:hypothetical protein